MKNILVIDDQGHNTQEGGFKEFFPDADFRVVTSYDEAEELFEDGFVPDILSTDCYDTGNYDQMFGIRNARKVLEWFEQNTQPIKKPIFFFKSADLERAEEARELTLKVDSDIEAYAIDVCELFLARELNDHNRTIDNRDAETTGFREFILKHLGLKLPMNDDEIDAQILENGNIEAEELVDLVEKGKFDRDEAIALIGKEAIDMSRSKWVASVDLARREDYDEIKDLSSSFAQAVGISVNGYAAFNKTDVNNLVKEGKKPILFLKNYTTSFIPYLDQLSGIVLLDAGLSGHMKMLLAAHGVSGALGGRNMSQVYPFLQSPDGKPFISSKNIHGEGKSRVFTDFEDTVYEIANSHCSEHLPDEWEDDEELKKLPPLIIDPNKFTPLSTIKFGDPVTLSLSEDSAYVWPLHLDLEEGRYSRIYRWTENVDDWLRDWLRDRQIELLQFKANVDSPNQGYQGSGIGLLRTEHFILASNEQQEAFKKSVLMEDKSAFSTLQEKCSDDLKDVFYPSSDNFPIRVRLADMPPVEIFEADELNDFENKYGSRNLRGVQLALETPALYEAQIRGIFDAVIEGRKEQADRWGDNEDCIPKVTPEIMVPTVKTLDELMFVQVMVAQIADEYELSREDYRFGSMLETKEACENIEEIVSECDFLSIGSNDLTEEVLGCPRHDFSARNAIMLEYREEKDPFLTLYQPVIDTLYDSVSRARAVNPDIQIDFCGAHAEDLTSLQALRGLRLSSVSLTPSDLNMNTIPLAYNFSTFQKQQANDNQPVLDVVTAPECSFKG